MKTYGNQITAFPDGCHVVVNDEFWGCRFIKGEPKFIIAVGTKGRVHGHCDDGRACFILECEGGGHTFSYSSVEEIPLRRDYDAEIEELKATIESQAKWLKEANAVEHKLMGKLRKIPALVLQLQKLSK